MSAGPHEGKDQSRARFADRRGDVNGDMHAHFLRLLAPATQCRTDGGASRTAVAAEDYPPSGGAEPLPRFRKIPAAAAQGRLVEGRPRCRPHSRRTGRSPSLHTSMEAGCPPWHVVPAKTAPPALKIPDVSPAFVFDDSGEACHARSGGCDLRRSEIGPKPAADPPVGVVELPVVDVDRGAGDAEVDPQVERHGVAEEVFQPRP